jgi:hypothetical protein
MKKKTEETMDTAMETVDLTKGKKKLPEGGVKAMIGEIVHFHKEIETSKGRAIETVAAMIVRAPDAGAGNLQAKDNHADLYCFTAYKGGANEMKWSVKFSETKEPNRWTFRE